MKNAPEFGLARVMRRMVGGRPRPPRTGPPAHEETSTLVWCDPDTALYQYVTAHTWTRNGSTPATCVACRNQRGLVLGWLDGHEKHARFRCRCGASWCDPLWARPDATVHVRADPEFERTGPHHPPREGDEL